MTKEQPIPSITVEELQIKLQHPKKNILIDVREPGEYEVACIPNSHLIPLGELPSRLNELEGFDEIYLHCRSGGRSARALQFLQEQGLKNLFNVEGGILAWADRIDPSIQKY